MGSCVAWYPFMLMLAISFAFSITNVLLKKLIISTIFLAPIALFVERNTSQNLPHAFRVPFLFMQLLEYTSTTYACGFLNIVPVVTFLMAMPSAQVSNQDNSHTPPQDV
ncbi:unnamed protein product [Cuscuta epithymum]|uniref:Uncharacterized protein n=1 Tax=Cuscuta epithymum TaxID=186058 RepID=A0AAV0D5B8_9ASTE|nr:unnamed protein product [Cuscuta epithymum]